MIKHNQKCTESPGPGCSLQPRAGPGNHPREAGRHRSPGLLAPGCGSTVRPHHGHPDNTAQGASSQTLSISRNPWAPNCMHFNMYLFIWKTEKEKKIGGASLIPSMVHAPQMPIMVGVKKAEAEGWDSGPQSGVRNKYLTQVPGHRTGAVTGSPQNYILQLLRKAIKSCMKKTETKTKNFRKPQKFKILAKLAVESCSTITVIWWSHLSTWGVCLWQASDMSGNKHQSYQTSTVLTSVCASWDRLCARHGTKILKPRYLNAQKCMLAG